VPAPTPEPPTVAPNAEAAAQQIADDKKKAAEERRKAEQAAAAAEAQKKANEAKAEDKPEKKDPLPQPPSVQIPPPVAQPPTPAKPVTEPTASRDACLLVRVVDANGQPVSAIRVGAVGQTDSPATTLFNGRTGPEGRWQTCGLTTGRSVRVAVFGPQGRVLGTQIIVARAGRNFVEITLSKRMDDATPGPFRPNRKRPFERP
jgi:ATPase subunit of ABC transporter with duplicated ATPase domains